MALVLKDRVKEVSTTASTGTFTLAGASTGFQSFAAIGNGNTTYYAIVAQAGTEWEVGIGTYTSAGTTLSRDTVLASSNSGSLVNFSGGAKDVFVTYPSEKGVWLDASGNASALGTPASFVGTNITGTAAGLTAGAATVLATARTIAGVSFDGSANISIALDDLSDVIIDTPVVNQLLGYNGTNWINTNAATAGAGSGVVFYNATPVISASGTQNNVRIATLATVPVVTAEQTVTGDSNANTVLFSAFVSAPLGRTVIDAGIWDFTNWVGVSSTTGSNLLTRQVYTTIPFLNTYTVTITGTGTTRTATASGGTPFATGVIDASATNTTASYLQTPAGLYQITARTSDTVVTINNVPTTYTNETAVAGTVLKKLFGITTPEINSVTPAYGLYEVTTTAGAYTVTAATGIGILGFFTCGNTHTITVPYNGTEHNTHVSTPLANLHNQLAGLNGGTSNEYYHSTLTEYTGTGTGVFVRATNAVMTSPNLDTPTALVGTNITGTGASFTAGHVTTNANLTGVITSVGNATSIASQTGTGTKFVVDTAPLLNAPTYSTDATFTAGTNAQGQGPITTDIVVVTTAALNPSGVTLPVPTVGRRIIIVNRGVGQINVYPSSGCAIDSLANNAFLLVSSTSAYYVNEFIAYSTTKWQSSNYYAVNPQAITGTVLASKGGTGQSTYAIGDLLYASAASSLSKLAAGTATYVLTSNGAGVAPSWATIGNAATVTTNANLTGGVTSVGNAATVVTNANLTGMVTSVGNAASLGSFTSLQLLTALTDETGSGAAVFATSPGLVTPLLGTPTSGNFSSGTFTWPTFNQDTTGKSAKTDALNSATTVVNVSSSAAPSVGQILTATSSTAATWQTAAVVASEPAYFLATMMG